MDQLQDRQNVPIWNAIEASNYKQAVKLVDKRLSKKPTEYLEALKIYICSHLPAVSEKTAVLLHLEELVGQKKPPQADGVLELYNDAFENVLESDGDWARVIGELRWQSVKANPKNEDLSLKSFQTCMEKDDLDHARQIANSLEKSFPSNRNYIFWNISLMFLYSLSASYPANQTKLWGSLALAQISKLATATKQNAHGAALPARSIQGPQELLLLHLITETYGKPEQRLEYLQDPQLGPESAASKGEWEIWRMKLRTMQDAQQWEELFTITANLLKRARTKDKSGVLSEAQLNDWIVWKTFMRSAAQLGDPTYKSKVRDEIEAQLDPASGIDKSWRRNVSLAWIKSTFDDDNAFSAKEESASKSLRLGTIYKFLGDFGDATTAYSDLQPFVEKLEPRERNQLLTTLTVSNYDVSTARAITKAVNNHKLIYLLTCNLPEAERSSSPRNSSTKQEFKCSGCTEPCGLYCETCLKSVATTSLAAYQDALDDKGEITKHLLTTDRHPADDLCVLSVMCLIKLGMLEEKPTPEPLESRKSRYFLQAAALLEKAWLQSKSNFEISLLLVRLYSYLGCGSLAMRAYQRLTLKQIQLDTLSYVLFDRISTFHPRPFTSHSMDPASDKTPLQRLQRQQQIYEEAYTMVSKNVWLSFKNGSYNSMFHIKNISKELSHGLGAAMSVIESRKVSRITEPKAEISAVSNGLDLLAPNPETHGVLSTDNLDYKSHPNYESTLSHSFEKATRFVPAPTPYRLRTSLFAEKLLLILSPSTPPTEQTSLLAWLKNYLSSDTPPTASDTASLTRPETLERRIHNAIASLLAPISESNDHGLEKRVKGYNKDLLDALDETLALVQEMQGVVPAYFTTLHVLYSAHGVGKFVLAFLGYLSRRGKDVHAIQAESSKLIEEKSRSLLKAVEETSTAIKKGMDEGWIDKVLDGALAEGSLLSADDPFMEEWAGDVVESWRECVAGLGYLKA